MLNNNKIKSFENNILYKGHLENEKYNKTTIFDRMKYYRTSALSIAFIKDYKLEFSKAYGTKKRNSDEKIDENTLFQAASISKAVFSVAVMRLVERKVLSLDEDVNNYLTSWKVPKNGNWQPKITLRQILTHTAGTTVQGFEGYNLNDEIPTTIQVLNGEYPANSEAVIVDTIPGLSHRYSGGGFTIAQQVLVDVLKKPFPIIMKQLVLDDLNMNNSTYEQPISVDYINNISCGYGYTGEEVEGMYYVYPEMAAAGLWTTPSDLCKLGLEIQNILNGKKDGILKLESVNEMLRKHCDIEGKIVRGIGFALVEDENRKNSKFLHSGENYGFESEFVFYNEGGNGFVIMINSNQEKLLQEVSETLEKVYELEGSSKEQIEIENRSIDNYSGQYINKQKTKIYVKDELEKLYIQVENQEAIEFKRKTKNTFISEEVNTKVELNIDKGGEKYIILQQNEEENKYEKID
ncbi:serine hydrolase domain-containing protein [Clostridium ihumii]|uniref:serine hydrolase domain-containing protein n=1 Tax=Clostridium ihumii TaxID=1470356 RepID=UPI000687EE8F|nr:serine hydrolase domain-containing protein [Clostridium ihumii]